MGVFGQIPQRAMTTRIEHRVESPGHHVLQLVRGGQQRLRGLVILEATGGVGLCRGVIALGVNRRLSAERRGQCDLRARVFEHVVRRSKFFQPEAGLLAGLTKLVV